MESINTRLLQFMKNQGISSSSLSKQIKVLPSSISHIVSGRNKPSVDFIQKFLKEFTYVNPNWLLLGEGEMKKETPNDQEIKNKSKLNDPLLASKIHSSISKDQLKRKKESEPILEKVIFIYNNGTFKEYKNN